MKQADGWLLSAFSCRQAFILEVEVSQVLPLQPVHKPLVKLELEVCSVFLLVGFVGCLFSNLLWCLSCMFFKVAAEET